MTQLDCSERSIQAQGIRGSETTVQPYFSELQDWPEPLTEPELPFRPLTSGNLCGLCSVPSSLRAIWLILSRQELLSEEKRCQRDIVMQTHPEENMA